MGGLLECWLFGVASDTSISESDGLLIVVDGGVLEIQVGHNLCKGRAKCI